MPGTNRRRAAAMGTAPSASSPFVGTRTTPSPWRSNKRAESGHDRLGDFGTLRRLHPRSEGGHDRRPVLGTIHHPEVHGALFHLQLHPPTSSGTAWRINAHGVRSRWLLVHPLRHESQTATLRLPSASRQQLPPAETSLSSLDSSPAVVANQGHRGRHAIGRLERSSMEAIPALSSPNSSVSAPSKLPADASALPETHIRSDRPTSALSRGCNRSTMPSPGPGSGTSTSD